MQKWDDEEAIFFFKKLYKKCEKFGNFSEIAETEYFVSGKKYFAKIIYDNSTLIIFQGFPGNIIGIKIFIDGF